MARKRNGKSKTKVIFAPVIIVMPADRPLTSTQSGMEPVTQRLGRALRRYTSVTNQSYDSAFERMLKTIRPDWFTMDEKHLIDNKQTLIEIAKSGGPRPGKKRSK